MVACYAGFLDIVVLLSGCPYVDINHQDNDGNTALMIAAQAGHDMIVNYLLNYYPGLEVEKRDARGLTALMKAAMQGCNNCVTALVLAGADLNAVDPVKGKTAREWAVFTGRFETIVQIRCLLQRPRAEQFSSEYLPEWPALPELVAKALATKTRGERMQEKIRSAFSFRFPRDPEVDGVMDHMVRMTTSLASPFVSTACRTICPLSPPEVGKRRLAVPEILRAQVPNAEPPAEAKTRSGAEELPGCSQPPALASSQPPGSMPSFLPLRLLRRSSIFPEDHVPRIKLTKPPAPPASAEEQLEESPDRNTLRLPKWRYKELREKRRAAKQLEEES
ncbi:PREDICTED: ankyrin repeat domain-containing protein 33 [Crocodylus porosus]|nr:PREDICTED: ankyrin repeat domain-containing protein 33 [Crocodylus porosus]